MTALALALAVGVTPGCDNAGETRRECTLIGWTEGLTVNIASDEPLTAGVYRFIADAPGETFELELPLVAPKNTADGVYVTRRLERDSWQVNASLAGSSRYGTDGAISIGRTGEGSGGPRSPSLTVLQDDTEIGALELPEIDYQRSEVNGPGCGVATTATASISIAPVQ